MNLGEINKLAWQEMSDETGIGDDKRVPDWLITSYANDAENEACRRARLIVDSTSMSNTNIICSIDIVAGTSVYVFDPRIIFIRRAKLVSASKPLGKAPFWELDEHYPNWDTKTGTVDRVVTGMDTGSIRLFRIPVANDTLHLTVVRLPLRPMSQHQDEPEINDRFHRSLVYWIKHKAYNNTDSELFDKNRADVHLALFEQEFGTKSAAINEVFDEMYSPYDNHDGHY